MTALAPSARKSRALSAAPASEPRAELLERARKLAGLTVGELSARLAVPLPSQPGRAKGFVGGLLERALGAAAGSSAGPDFPGLGVELKTIPLSAQGRPRESTFVCTVSVRDITSGDWSSSLVRQKLACVLFVPIESAGGLALGARRIGRARLWSPSPRDDAALRADFEELIGVLGRGDAELLTGHHGRWLQVRPKAASSRQRARGVDENGAPIRWLPRGFYLRASFTEQIFSPGAQHLP